LFIAPVWRAIIKCFFPSGFVCFYVTHYALAEYDNRVTIIPDNRDIPYAKQDYIETKMQPLLLNTARNYEIAEKTSGLPHKLPVEYEFPLKKHIKTRYFANNRIIFVLYLTFERKMTVFF